MCASLNHVYRLVWSQVYGAWVAVAETVRGRGKGGGRRAMNHGRSAGPAIHEIAAAPVCRCRPIDQAALLLLAALAGVFPATAWAAGLTPVAMPIVGSTVFDPNTGTNLTVVTPVSGVVTPFVQVSNGDLIFIPNQVDDSFTGSNGNTWYVNSVTTSSGNVTSVNVVDCGTVSATLAQCTSSAVAPASQNIYSGTVQSSGPAGSSGSG